MFPLVTAKWTFQSFQRTAQRPMAVSNKARATADTRARTHNLCELWGKTVDPDRALMRVMGSMIDAAALLAAMIYAINSILLRMMGKSERSVVIMLYPMLANFVVAGLALPFVYKPLPIQHLGLLAVMSATGFVAGLIMIGAYRRAPAVIVAPMQYSQIIWGVIFGAIFFQESADWVTFLGTAIIIASGIYIVQREGKTDVSLNRPVTEARAGQDMGLTARLSSWRKKWGGRSFKVAEYDDPS